MRGLRLPELCAGDLFASLRTLADRASVGLLLALPSELPDETRTDLLSCFERGRSCLIHTLSLKLSCFMSPPLLLCAANHHSTLVAREALKQCIGSTSSHPLMLELRRPPLSDQALAFCEEEMELELLPELELFVSRLHFGHSSERRVEGVHAFVKRRAGMSRNRSEAWDSLSLRMKEITSILDSDAKFFEMLSSLISVPRNPKMLAHSLGMEHHRALVGVRSVWDSAYRRAIYRADTATLYGQRLEVDDPPAGPGGPAVGPAAGTADSTLDRRPTAPAESTLELSIRREACLDFIKLVVDNLAKSGGELAPIVVCRTRPEAVQSLTRVLVEDGCKSAASFALGDMHHSNHLALADMFEFDNKIKYLWFSILDSNPHRAKRCQQGNLADTDWAIAVHTLLAVDKPHAMVTSTPINVARASALHGAMEQVPLVLSTSVFTLAELTSMGLWACLPQPIFMWQDAKTDDLKFALASEPLTCRSGRCWRSAILSCTQ